MLRNNLFIVFLFLLAPGVAQQPTYQADIRPIIQKHCVSCHQPGEAGPMSLTSYEDVASNGTMIRYVTGLKLMPPWYADTSYSHFANERKLNTAEVKKIRDWVDNGMIDGNPVPPKNLPPSGPSTLRKPDLILSMSSPFEQSGLNVDGYQAFVIPTHLKENTWIDGIEFVPGNKKIVRFAAVSVETSSKFDSLDSWDPRYGYYSFGGLGLSPEQPHWYTWSLQQPATFYHGSAKLLPKNANLVLHVHYGPTDSPEMDSSTLRLYFANKKPSEQIITAPLINPYVLENDSLYIDAYRRKTFHASCILPHDIRLVSLTPQSNLISRKWDVFAQLPDQTTVRLLKIKDWNFNWKETYRFASPVVLPAGTVIHALAQYDNTPDNPHNPSNKPAPVHWGAQVFSELFFVHFEYLSGVNVSDEVSISMPVVVSGDSLEVNMDIRMPANYSGWVCHQDGAGCVEVFKIKKGEMMEGLPVVIKNFPEGNYVLRIKNEKEKIVAQQVFVKMRENGM